MARPPCILVSWLGHADLLGWAAGLPPKERQEVERALAKSVPATSLPGPLRAAILSHECDHVHLLADGHVSFARRLMASMTDASEVHAVRVNSPIDYASVFAACEEVLTSVVAKHGSHAQLWMNLSSGTPAMTATLLMLGKTRYPARFLQSFRGQAEEVNIPFDLTLDYLPELLREPDATLQALADRAPSEVSGFEAIVGKSRPIRMAVGRAKRAAIRDVSVLILGESGVGKELFARAIHEVSPRRKGPFVPVNCAAIPRELQASTLFGHKKGAFTGATTDRPGAFHEADGGTLFLDEFGELDPSAQALLLRALQPVGDDSPSCRRIRRVGALADEKLDVRIIAATNRSPRDAVSEGRLRVDLFYRVATIVLRIPALRDRRSDIPEITDALLGRLNAAFQRSEPNYENKSLSPSANAFVKRCDWRGNVRELNNVLVQAAVMCPGKTIDKVDVEAAAADAANLLVQDSDSNVVLGDGFDVQAHLEHIHRRLLERAMNESKGVKTKAAQLLGLKSYQTLDAQLRRLGVRWQRLET